jgi:hypothetical protein
MNVIALQQRNVHSTGHYWSGIPSSTGTDNDTCDDLEIQHSGDAGLDRILASWPSLSTATRQAILDLLETETGSFQRK